MEKLKARLAQIPEYTNHVVYHWRNNPKSRMMDLSYFIGYRVGAVSGVYEHKTNVSHDQWKDSDIEAIIAGYQAELERLND